MAWPLSSPTIAEVHAKVARRRRVALTLNEDEVRALYALAQHDAQGSFGCPLEHTPDGIAGTHPEHETAVATALMKLSEALIDVQEGGETDADREFLGRLVRETWVTWAREQPDPKPSWLLGWNELDDGQREVDMRIGKAIEAWVLGRPEGNGHDRPVAS